MTKRETMLATTLGIPFDADKAWEEREQQYKMGGEIVKTRPFIQTAEGDKNGLWTSVISAVVFILDKQHRLTSARGRTV